MNNNLRTAALVAVGMVSAGAVAQAEEAQLSPVQTALSATTLSGYVSSSAFFNVGENEGGPRLPGRTFDAADKVNQINLDVVKLSLEKPLDEGDWSAGYKVDLLFGEDANTLGTSSVLGAGTTADFSIKQAYVTLQAPVGNDLIAKIGVFDTIIGYEVFEAGNNPNYSRAYSYFIQPFQHTGVLLSYALTDWLSINAGVADAWDSRINAPGRDSGNTKDLGVQSYLGSVAITVPDSAGFLSGTTIYGGIVHGLSADFGDGDPRTSLYGGITIPTPVENLGVGLAYDYRFTEIYRGPGVSNAKEWATTMGAYLSYQFTEQLKLNLRGEYAAGSAGTWLARPMGDVENEEFFALTTSLDYNLWANVLTRFEFRWDTDLSEGGRAFGSVVNPEKNAYILGLNVIYKF